MIKRIRRKRIKTVIFFIIILLAIIGVSLLIKINNNSKNSYEVSLEKELKQVSNIANKAWRKAHSTGKEGKEFEEYIRMYLEKENVDVNKYYLTVSSKGVKVAKKHIGLLSESGYYKAGTNYTEIIKSWQQLVNSRNVNVVEGRLGLLRKADEKIDVTIDKSVTEIKEKVVEEGLEIGTLIIPNSVVNIAKTALKDAQIEEVVLEANIQELDGHFNGMNSLKRITITGATTLIRGKTFKGTNIEEVNFIGTVEQLVAIKYLTYHDVPSHDKKCKLYLNGVLVEELAIPDTVAEIKDYALHNYTNITKIIIPNTVKYIGTSAFTGTSAKEIIYDGTKEMWDKIIKMEEWHFNEIDCTVYCTNGNIVYGKGVEQ